MGGLHGMQPESFRGISLHIKQGPALANAGGISSRPPIVPGSFSVRFEQRHRWVVYLVGATLAVSPYPATREKTDVANQHVPRFSVT